MAAVFLWAPNEASSTTPAGKSIVTTPSVDGIISTVKSFPEPPKLEADPFPTIKSVRVKLAMSRLNEILTGIGEVKVVLAAVVARTVVRFSTFKVAEAA